MPKHRKPTNAGFQLGHSRLHDMLSEREERHLSIHLFTTLPLMAGVIGIVIGVAISL